MAMVHSGMQTELGDWASIQTATQACMAWTKSVVHDDEIQLQEVRDECVVPDADSGLYVVLMPSIAFKVGITTRLKKRLEDLKVGSPFPLELLAFVPAGPEPRDFERAIHHQLRPWNTQGEWYLATTESLRTVLGITRLLSRFAQGLSPEHYQQVARVLNRPPTRRHRSA